MKLSINVRVFYSTYNLIMHLPVEHSVQQYYVPVILLLTTNQFGNPVVRFDVMELINLSSSLQTSVTGQ